MQLALFAVHAVGGVHEDFQIPVAHLVGVDVETAACLGGMGDFDLFAVLHGGARLLNQHQADVGIDLIVGLVHLGTGRVFDNKLSRVEVGVAEADPNTFFGHGDRLVGGFDRRGIHHAVGTHQHHRQIGLVESIQGKGHGGRFFDGDGIQRLAVAAFLLAGTGFFLALGLEFEGGNVADGQKAGIGQAAVARHHGAFDN